MARDVPELSGRMIRLQNSIVVKIRGFLGGQNAVHGMQEDVFLKAAEYPSPPNPNKVFKLEGLFRY